MHMTSWTFEKLAAAEPRCVAFATLVFQFGDLKSIGVWDEGTDILVQSSP